MKRLGVAGIVVTLVLTTAVYLPALQGQELWDDDVYLTRNPLVTHPEGYGKIWFSFEHPSQYFPLVYTAFRVQHQLWGLNLEYFHLTNILLHVANAFLLWRIFLALSVPGALLATALWALHPMQVESVAWITELKNTLSTFFLLFSLLAWIRHLELGERLRWGRYAVSLGAFLLALFSKTTASTLPALMVAAVLWRKEQLGRRRILEIAPFALLGLMLGSLTIWWERAQGTVGPDFDLSLVERSLVAGRALWFYLGQIFWPASLSFSYPRWRIDAGAPLQYLWPLAAIAFGLLLWRIHARAGRGAALASMSYLASLSPLLGFIPLYTFRYSFVADHYGYVAIAFPLAFVAALWMSMLPIGNAPSSVSRSRFAAWLLPPLLIISLMASLTWRRAHVFRDSGTLWEDTVKKNPESWLALSNLGGIYLSQGRIPDALRLMGKAVALKPDDSIALGNLGVALLRSGRADEGILRLQEALRLDPNQKSVRANLDWALTITKRRNITEPRKAAAGH